MRLYPPSNSSTSRTTVTWLVVALLLGSCGETDRPDTPEARGRRTYLTYCVVCHNADPGKEGPQGPAIAGSSEELLVARVLGQTYPPGYKPKRSTQTMPVYPQVKDRIPELAAFLNGSSKKDAVQ